MDASDLGIRPSEITDVRFLFWPPGSDDVEVDEGGKWMVFLDGRFEFLDRYWNALRTLCGDNGVLYKIRSTTAVDREGGLINCYTRNAEDKRDVRKAAVAIFEAVQFDRVMFYKTNRASEDGQFRNQGKTNIAKYKYTTDKRFYERISSMWQPVWRC